jgi:hypothetical protein
VPGYDRFVIDPYEILDSMNPGQLSNLIHRGFIQLSLQFEIEK